MATFASRTRFGCLFDRDSDALTGQASGDLDDACLQLPGCILLTDLRSGVSIATERAEYYGMVGDGELFLSVLSLLCHRFLCLPCFALLDVFFP